MNLVAPEHLVLEGSIVDRWKAARSRDLYTAACLLDARIAEDAARLEESGREIRSIFSRMVSSVSPQDWSSAFLAPFRAGPADDVTLFEWQRDSL